MTRVGSPGKPGPYWAKLQGERGSEALALLWASGEMPLGAPAVVLLPGHRAWSDVFEMRRGHYQARLAGRCYTLLCFRKGLPEGRGMVWGVSVYGTLHATQPRCSRALTPGACLVRAHASFQIQGSGQGGPEAGLLHAVSCCQRFQQVEGFPLLCSLWDSGR